jgi:23S rRNA A1618 N6-methylase RlmF
MCNPPFFKHWNEGKTGRKHEMACRGGEVKFIKLYFNQTKGIKGIIFTSMVGKKSHIY